MNSFYKITIFFICSFLFISCSQKTPTLIETIVVTPSVAHEQFFSDFVKSIEVIPLETKEDLFIRNRRVMEVYKEDLYISNVNNGLQDDSRGESNIILRFDKFGKFINKIGHFSRSGKDTYFFYESYSLDSIAYIFSSPNFCVNKYTLSGEFISKDTLAPLAEFKQAAFFNDEYIVNISSYFPDEDNMLLFFNKQGKVISKQIPLKTKLRPSGITSPSFTKYKKLLFYRDEYKDTIYQISDKGVVSPRLFVDYGEERRNNKEDFIRKYNSKKDRDEYDNKTSASSFLYYESDDYHLLEIGEYGDPKKFRVVCRFALKNKISGQVDFVDFNKENTIFNNAVQFLDGKKLYFLVQARRLTAIAEWMKPYFVNLQALDNIKPEDNDLVFIFNLK